MKSETPRTEIARCNTKWTPADFSRQLERELNLLKSALTEITECEYAAHTGAKCQVIALAALDNLKTVAAMPNIRS